MICQEAMVQDLQEAVQAQAEVWVKAVEEAEWADRSQQDRAASVFAQAVVTKRLIPQDSPVVLKTVLNVERE